MNLSDLRSLVRAEPLLTGLNTHINLLIRGKSVILQRLCFTEAKNLPLISFLTDHIVQPPSSTSCSFPSLHVHDCRQICMTRVIVVSVLCNCCYCFLLVARHVLLNVVKCDSKLLIVQMSICVHSSVACHQTCPVSYEENCLLSMKCLILWMQISCKRMCEVLFQCREALREIHSFIWVSDVGVKGKRLGRLFNSACWWAVNQAWAFDNMPDCTASHASVCPHKAAHDVTQNWSILINHWPFRGCTGTIVNWLSK